MLSGLSTLAQVLDTLAAGRVTATVLLDHMLEQAATPEAGAIYTGIFEQAARAEAGSADIKRAAGAPVGQLAGLPIAVKDLFDVAGHVTRSGSKLLADAPPASADAAAVLRLRQAGAVVTGHTNMTEFAYSGLGLNPHYGTPGNPMASARIPGGSSSGSAAAVARGVAAAALGTDSGGSVRIPAAFCGLVGFKPTQSRIPRDGMFPLTQTLDCVGTIAPSVDCCARLDAVLSGTPSPPLAAAKVQGLRIMAPTNYVLDGLDRTVSDAFENALRVLSRAGALVTSGRCDVLDQLPDLERCGGFTAAESYHVHRHWLASSLGAYDPRVSMRIEEGRSMLAADYLELLRSRSARMAEAARLFVDCDALVMPTVPIVPPLFTELEFDDDYLRINQLVVRNPTVGNLLDLCAISLPCHRHGDLPTGLMLMAGSGNDRQLLRLAAGVEALLNEK